MHRTFSKEICGEFAKKMAKKSTADARLAPRFSISFHERIIPDGKTVGTFEGGICINNLHSFPITHLGRGWKREKKRCNSKKTIIKSRLGTH